MQEQEAVQLVANQPLVPDEDVGRDFIVVELTGEPSASWRAWFLEFARSDRPNRDKTMGGILDFPEETGSPVVWGASDAWAMDDVRIFETYLEGLVARVELADTLASKPPPPYPPIRWGGR